VTAARTSFTMKSWEEKIYLELGNGGRLTRVTMSRAFEGDVDGEGLVDYLMVYSTDGSASFVGMERVVGRVGGRSGSFVLEHHGTFQGGVVQNTWSVVPGSGTGDLRGLRGEGGFASGHQERYPMTFDYSFE
jgi:hypothetical protein